MKNLSKLVLFLFLFFSLFAIRVNAQIPPPRVPCDPGVTEDPEFHSLRPYQASPCGGDGEMGYFCGNKIIILEEKTKKITDEDQGVACQGRYNFSEQGELDWENIKSFINRSPKEYWIDISETEFPIAGNTEQVSNSQTKADVFDDATKVNEYASWYLNGVINRAEYGDTKNTDNELVNFSGPIQKLMPSIILEAQRIGTINLINNTVAVPDSEDDLPESERGTALNHNQIVVCSDSNIPIIGNLLNLGKFKPIPCYKGDGSSAKGFLGLDKEIGRLKDWNDDLSFWNSYTNTIVDLISGLLPNVARNVIEESVGDHWNKRTPPLPWSNMEDEPFEKDVLYRKAYNEWKGKTCVLIPVFDFLICFENIFVPNRWSDLFPYVPLSTTADKNKKMPIDTVTIQPTGGVVMPESEWNDFDDKGEPVFYFPHTGEVATLSAFLNKTYIPKDIPEGEVDFKTTESNENTPGECRSISVRSNEGDNLFPIKEPGDIGVEVYFRVTEIPQVGCQQHNTINGPVWVGTYSGTVTIEIHTKPVKVPFAKETWESTVAGPTSTVRRIFPKVEKGAPIDCIADIPSETKAVYTPVEGTDEIGVKSLQNPEQKFDPNDARIYFPHWGSIYDYFLKGIQTALRPKGYGEKIVSGTLCENQEVEETMCPVDVPDSEVDSKFLGSFKINFIDLANRWTSTCTGPENNLAEECYNYVASEAKKAGVNPAFALTIWLNESGASNYCFGGETTQDLGINLSDLYQNIVGQVEAFLSMAKTKLCDGVPGFVEPMHGWLSRFQSSAGICDPSDQTATDYYYNVMNETWSYLTSCVSGGKFGITWPTDSSCP